MTSSPGNDPVAVAVALLVFGGGVLLLATLFGVWVALAGVVGVSVGLATGVEVHHRRSAQRERQQHDWDRIVREERGYGTES